MKISEHKVEGSLDLKGLNSLLENEYDVLDLSEAEMGYDEEYYEICLGWSHSGPVYGGRGYRKVEVLVRMLEKINASVILLPDNVMRRHINAAKKNIHIKELRVRQTCPNFYFEDGKLMNKKKTKPVFGCLAITVEGEIRGEWDTYYRTMDIILSDSEILKMTELVKASPNTSFLNAIKKDFPKLSEEINSYFCHLAWKQVVKDGMGYYNLSRAEAQNAEMSGDEYEVFIPKFILNK